MLRMRLRVTSRFEFLEDRRLLAANLVGHWTADDFTRQPRLPVNRSQPGVDSGREHLSRWPRDNRCWWKTR